MNTTELAKWAIGASGVKMLIDEVRSTIEYNVGGENTRATTNVDLYLPINQESFKEKRDKIETNLPKAKKPEGVIKFALGNVTFQDGKLRVSVYVNHYWK